MIYISGFILCAGIIFWAGKKLAYYGEVIAEITGMGKSWTGLVLMATITSLPELMSGISSSAIVESADLAAGDILGSCAFNLFILAILDAFTPKNNPLFTASTMSNVLAAALGLILVSLAGLAIYLPDEIVLLPSIGITSLSFLIIYLFSLRIMYQHNRRHAIVLENAGRRSESQSLTLNIAVRRYIVYAIFIVSSALSLPWLAGHISAISGLNESFVGTLFLAISTSLPEISVSVAAVRSGAIDMAVGNLFGSNIFNILILFIDDLFYTKGHLLKDASDINLVSVFSVILMSSIAIIGLTLKIPGKRFTLAYDALLILFVYIMNIIMLLNLT
jgi:cation:H+ antiporter